MNPRHIDSLKISSLGTLDMGTVVTCVKIKADATPPTNSPVSWPDGASMFHLLPQHDFATGTMDEQSSSLQNEPEYHLIYEAGSSNAVWIVGNEVVCKVHGWKEGIQLESGQLLLSVSTFLTYPLQKWCMVGLIRPSTARSSS
jgi:hypothetical protein